MEKRPSSPAPVPEASPAPVHVAPARRVTLRDVAVAAGVNVSTASRALRGDPRITAATRARVEAAAAAASYAPNPYVTAFAVQVRARRFGLSHATVAVLGPGFAGGSLPDWVRPYNEGIAAEAAREGFAVESIRLGAPGLETPSRVGRVLRARGIRGLVILPVTDDVSLEGFPFDGFACSTIDPSLRNPPMNRACPDYFQGMRLALDKLHAAGRRRIGFHTTRSEMARIGSHWLGSYLGWQAENAPGESLPPLILQDPRFFSSSPRARDAEWRHLRDGFARWIDRERPDAIVSNLLHTHTWLEELGIRTPGDILFAALGKDSSRPCPYPGVDQRSEMVGRFAFGLVAHRIYRNEFGLPAVPLTMMVPAVWSEASPR